MVMTRRLPVCLARARIFGFSLSIFRRYGNVWNDTATSHLPSVKPHRLIQRISCNDPCKVNFRWTPQDTLFITSMNQYNVGEPERRNAESNFPTTIITGKIDDSTYSVTENDYINSVLLDLLPPLPKEKSSRPKRKRQPLDASSSSFDITRVLPHAGETEWDPASGLYHTGKWPVEEERYANRLVLEFEAGVLEDCKDGVTLRSYLAKTLRCAPMRVSKKFAGKCIGSKAFCRREGDRKSFLEKITAGELSIASLQKRLTQKSSTVERKTSKQIRQRSPSDLTDDDYDSRSSISTNDQSELSASSSDGGDCDSDSQGKKQATSKRKYKTGKKKESTLTDSPHGIAVVVSEDASENMFCGPLSTEIDPPAYEYGLSGFYLSNAADPIEPEFERTPHIIDVGYDEWRNALSYFKENDSACDGLFRSQSNISLML